MFSHVIGIDIDVYSAFVVIFNILCLEVVYDSMRLFYWYLHYIYDLILYLCYVLYRVLFYWYLLCSRKVNFYVIHRQSNFCILYSVSEGASCFWLTWVKCKCQQELRCSH